MKKLILAALVLFSAQLSAQFVNNSIKLGYFNPPATEGGFIVGFEGGKYIDRNFSYGFSLDWFHTSFVDAVLVEEFNRIEGFPNYRLNELRAKTNIHSFPVMFNLTANFPVAPRVSTFITGGIGAEVLLIFSSNYQNPNDDDFEGAFDFNWRIGTGLSFAMGRRSNIFFELAYHNAEPSWTYEIKDDFSNHVRVFERAYDMSGMLARIGFRFYY